MKIPLRFISYKKQSLYYLSIFLIILLNFRASASVKVVSTALSCEEELNKIFFHSREEKKDNDFRKIGLIIESINNRKNISEFMNSNNSQVTHPIGVAKSGLAEQTSSGGTRLTYTIFVKNYSSVRIEDVQILDDLEKVFDSNTQYRIFSAPKVSTKSTLKSNPKFDGSKSINLLSSGSYLEPGVQDTVTFVLSILNTDDFSKMFKNQVLAKATIENEDFEDLSVSGDNPDADHDGDPSNDSGYTINLVDPGEINPDKIKVVIPEGISPNGDGLNDVFTITDEDKLINLNQMGIIELKIFNRWGSLVYKSTNYAKDFEQGEGWYGQSNTDGVSFKGSLPMGVYFYKISSSDARVFDGKYKLGSITLLN